MDNRQFYAQNWLGTRAQVLLNSSVFDNEGRAASLPLSPPGNTQSDFSLSRFVVPSWKGGSLVTKEGLKLKTIFSDVNVDVRAQLQELVQCNRSLKFSLFNEFLEFLNLAESGPSGLDNMNVFWAHFSKSGKSEIPIIEEFKTHFSAQVTIIYLYKCRFLLQLSQGLNVELDTQALFHPDSSLRKMFRKGSSTELHCGALSQNQFSWFRPTELLKGRLRELKVLLGGLQDMEIIKICNIEMQKLKFCADTYSHSLSHVSFGKFLNQLLIDFPIWLDKETAAYQHGIEHVSTPEIKAVTTLIVGDYHSSLAKGHWLAQEVNLKYSWLQIVCPQFIDSTTNNMHFVGISNELLFLTFLTHFTKHQGHAPIELICHLYRQINDAYREKGHGQISIFDEMSDHSEKRVTNDRIVLNLLELPKKNPHHFVCQKINNSEELLAKNGRIVVLSNQKLFVPSQSERVEQVLRKFEIELQFSFEGLKGKGEVPSFVYLLKRRSLKFGNHQNFVGKEKESCLSFTIEGEISQFQKFEHVVSEFFNIFEKKSPTTTPFYQKEICQGKMNISFHQDAIIDGKLLSATGTNKNQMAHPHFFKNLTKNCVPFNLFFNMDTLEGPYYKGNGIPENLLGVHVRKEERYPLLLIVNYNDMGNISIELTSMDLFNAKYQENGQAFFQYFGLSPKRSDINVNSFREFFNSSIGRQIIQLTLSGRTTKIKSKVQSLLIPKFFLNPKEISHHHSIVLDILKKEERDLLGLDLLKFERELIEHEVKLDHFIQEYPWKTFCLLSTFKHETLNAIDTVGNQVSGKMAQVDFGHTLIREVLVNCQLQALYPYNDEVYVLPKIDTPSDIHRRFTHAELDQHLQGPRLSLFSNESKIVEIYSDSILLQFLFFLLSSAPEIPISTLIQNLKVPPLEVLKRSVKNYENVCESLHRIHAISHQKIEKLILDHLSR